MTDLHFLLALGVVFLAHRIGRWLTQRFLGVQQALPPQFVPTENEASRLRPLQWLHSLLFAVLFTPVAAACAGPAFGATSGLLLGFGAGLLIYGSEWLWHLGTLAGLRSYFLRHAAAGLLACLLPGLLTGIFFQ